MIETLYTQRSRKDGERNWTLGVESHSRAEIVYNIMDTIRRKNGLDSVELESWCLATLLQYGRVHIDTITYDVLDSSEPI